MKRANWLLTVASLGLMVGLVSCATGPRSGKSITLFNGKDFSGWKAFAKGGGTLEGTWSVRDGVIVCSGEPMGYLYTDRSYTNFILTAEYRWPEGKEPSNSGLFARISGEPQPLPRTIECQLKHESAGDLYGFHGLKVAPTDGLTNRVRFMAGHEVFGELNGVTRVTGNENPPGQWNQAELTVDGEMVTVRMNGRFVNSARTTETRGGPVGLQSEGGPVEFRNVRLQPLP
jgi:hypothetical protein